MCCFSGRVTTVASTKIFARMIAPGRQVIAYQLRLAADDEVAMILPIPTPPRSPESAVRFVSLEAYPALFDDLERAFPVPRSAPLRQGIPAPAPLLVVHQVGAFVASFVPTLADFDRLDPRFRVPPGTIDREPIYSDWGFAVFQLATTEARGAIAKIHPMAFEMPTRSDQLFFPTVHVHDGTLPETAEFDHVLYAQPATVSPVWSTAGRLAGTVVDVERAAGLVDPDATVARLHLHGPRPNVDTWVATTHPR